MPNREDQKICLAMIVRDEQAIIERCLLAVKPFIDCWLIHDLGSSDNTVDLIKRTLEGVPGKVEPRALLDFSKARNVLLSRAANVGDLILMIDADEEFQCLVDTFDLNNDAQIGLLDIAHAGYHLRQPRLFRSGAIPKFQYPVQEQLEAHNMTIDLVEDITLKHHRDGIRHRTEHNDRIDHFLLNNELSNDLNNPELRLAMGKQELKSNNLENALEHFNVLADADADISNHPQAYWQACYLAASILSKQRSTVQAIELYQRCFDLDVDRLEPIMRIAEIHHSNGEHSVAQQLCELIIGSPVPKLVDYYEPAIYQYSARLMLTEITLINNDLEASRKIINPLLEHRNLPASVVKQVNELNNRINISSVAPVVDTQKSELAESPIPQLTIGMATYDDYDGVYFSIISIILYHQEVLEKIEILVIDNNPSSAHGQAVKNLCDRVPLARYVPAGEYHGTTIKGLVFSEARADLALCIDCHVFLHSGSIARLIDYFEQHPDSSDLLHGPMFYDSNNHFSTHMEERWNGGFYGVWATDERAKDIDADPFEIPLQGMGLFACRRKYWPGFNPRFRGFGGEEGYIHEKIRQHGGSVLCLPFLRWTHRFDRPNGAQYMNSWEDRVRNYLLGWHELKLNTNPILKHFSEHVGQDITATTHAAVKREIAGPLWAFNAIYCVIDSDEQWQNIQSPLKLLAIDRVTQKIDRDADLSTLLEMAKNRNLDNVIIIDGAIGFANHLDKRARALAKTLLDETLNVIYSSQLADTQTSNNDSPTGAHFCLINANAFTVIIDCIKNANDLTHNTLMAHAPELKISIESPEPSVGIET